MPRLETAAFEPFATTTRTGVITSKLLFKLFTAVDNTYAPFDVRFRRETPASFAHGLKSKDLRHIGFVIAWFYSANEQNADSFSSDRDGWPIFRFADFTRKTTLNWRVQKISGP